MKYFVITAKHHEGFALFRSRVSSFNSADGTPAHRDIIEECANACARHGLKLGLYYSQELDWSHPHGGGYRYSHLNVENMSWTNDWDYPDNEHKDYMLCYQEKIKPQVEEILTGYGNLGLIWFGYAVRYSKKRQHRIVRACEKASAALLGQFASRKRRVRLRILGRQ